MIQSFRDKNTEAIFRRKWARRFQSFAPVALRKLIQIDSAEELRDLASPPANRLESLKGDRAGQYGVRITSSTAFVFAGATDMLTILKTLTIIEPITKDAT